MKRPNTTRKFATTEHIEQEKNVHLNEMDGIMFNYEYNNTV